jgi:hypothetical protein
MAGEEDVVVARPRPPARVTQTPSLSAHFRTGAVQAQPVPPRRDEPLDIPCRTARDHAPTWAVVDRQHAVVVHEAHEEARGKASIRCGSVDQIAAPIGTR